MAGGKRIIRIGRSRTADVVIADSSVSRAHAELVTTPDGRFYVTDCGSTYGTHVEKNGEWTALRQGFVDGETPLRLGGFVTCPRELVEKADSKSALLQKGSEEAYRQSQLHGPTRPSPVEED